MSDLKNYIAGRKSKDKGFAFNFDKGYEDFKIGVLLRQAGEKAASFVLDITTVINYSDYCNIIQ